MIKYKKSELQNMLRALQELCNNAGQGFEPDELSYAMAQAQGLAYNMGTNIEEYHTGGEEIVYKLESYCEYAYNLAANVEDALKAKRLLKKMDKLLLEIELQIKYKLSDDKREIVFFPYKASMWDCMESVWAAAKKDERFDVFVVPIPYYKKNEKGELHELCYEGADFPSYVELTYFEDYNTENRRPDVIYVHNPYDDFNAVTCVHKDYYLRNLRKHTDMLVYIPYYLTDETERIIEDEGIERVTTAGISLSGYVIVQSEKVKAAFVESVSRLVPGTGGGG